MRPRPPRQPRVKVAAAERRPRPRKLGNEQAQRVVALYAEGMTLKQIAPKVGVSWSTVGETLRREGVTLRGIKAATRRLAVDEHAFDVITPESAYWAGFFFADGTIYRAPAANSDHVCIHISECDRKHLEQFRSFLGSSHTIYTSPAATFVRNGRTYTAKPTVEFKVASDALADRLRALGRYSGPIAGELTSSRDFWRGAIDGDGSLGTYPNPYKPLTTYPRIELVGSGRLLDEFLAFLDSHGLAGRMTVRERKGANMSVVGTSGTLVPQIVDLLYRDATVSLDRKAQRAAVIIGTLTPRHREDAFAAIA